MPEWWSYTLSDFLLFSPRAYYRMIERHNVAVWPGQFLTLGLGLVIAGLLRWRPSWHGRAVSAILGLLWSWVTWAFLWERYATINWAVRYAVWLLAIEVMLLVWIGIIRGGLTFHPTRTAAGLPGIALFVLALALYPLIAPLLGRGWGQAEIFGIAPDPTALATLGLVLLVERRPRWALLVVPALWCVFGGVTLWAMGSPEAWLMLPAALLAVGVSAFRSP